MRLGEVELPHPPPSYRIKDDFPPLHEWALCDDYRQGVEGERNS